VVFCAVIFGLNIISTRFFAEGEFWFSLVKVPAGTNTAYRSRRR
jgi:amino acid permease